LHEPAGWHCQQCGKCDILPCRLSWGQRSGEREVALHACQRLPATQLACNHDRGDGGRDRVRGPCDAAQHAAAPDRHGDRARGWHLLRVGKRYRNALARENVEVQLAPTPGSVENLAMLRDPHSGVSVALIQSGIVGAENTSGVESLGTVFYEPMWWFHRREI